MLAVHLKDRQRNKNYELWQGTFDLKEFRTEKFILQKLNYIHNNPCSGTWKLCEKPHQYPHSSATFYNGDKSGYPVKDYWDVDACAGDSSVKEAMMVDTVLPGYW